MFLFPVLDGIPMGFPTIPKHTLIGLSNFPVGCVRGLQDVGVVNKEAFFYRSHSWRDVIGFAANHWPIDNFEN